MSIMRALAGDNVERALRALERIAKALEEANKIEQHEHEE